MSRTFLVTGANRGIGLEFTRQLLEHGHKVIATARSAFNAKSLQHLNKDYGAHLLIEELDVASNASAHALAARLGNRTIDTLINNAGVLFDTEADLPNLSLDKLHQTLEINSVGPVRVTQALLPNLLHSKHPMIVNMTSLMGSIADNQSGGAYAYRMSKAALNMLTKNLALDYPQITTICLHPGWVQTEMGGENALISPEESVKGLLHVIEGAKKSDSGSFFNFKGQPQPW